MAGLRRRRQACGGTSSRGKNEKVGERLYHTHQLHAKKSHGAWRLYSRYNASEIASFQGCDTVIKGRINARKSRTESRQAVDARGVFPVNMRLKDNSLGIHPLCVLAHFHLTL